MIDGNDTRHIPTLPSFLGAVSYTRLDDAKQQLLVCGEHGYVLLDLTTLKTIDTLVFENHQNIIGCNLDERIGFTLLIHEKDTLCLVDITNHTVLWQLMLDSLKPRTCSWSPDGSTIVVTFSDCRVVYLNTDRNHKENIELYPDMNYLNLHTPGSQVTLQEWSSDGQQLVFLQSTFKRHSSGVAKSSVSVGTLHIPTSIQKLSR